MMKSKPGYIILLGFLVVGLLLALRNLNSTPALPVVPDGSAEDAVPSSPAQGTQIGGPSSVQPGAPGKDTFPGTATASTTTPGLDPGTSQQTPTPSTPILVMTPAMLPTEGFIGKSPTPPGRLAPDYVAAPLKFEKIRVFMNDAGGYSGIANVTNSGETFLNSLVIKWNIVDKSGIVLDQGQISWPNLAPGETASVSFVGTKPYNDLWEIVAFEFEP